MSAKGKARVAARYVYGLPICYAGTIMAKTHWLSWGSLLAAVLIMIGILLVDFAYEPRAAA